MSSPTLRLSDRVDLVAQTAKVASHVVGEHLRPRKAIVKGDVPRSYREITPQWLTAVMCEDFPGAEILAVEPTGGSVGTSSRQGLRLSLNADAERAGLPTRVFTKATPKLTQRLLMGLPGTIWGEVVFYQHLRNHLNIEAPRGYYACVDSASLRSMVIMEDIAVSRGAKFISTETYITRELIESLLTDMAHYHGKYWGDNTLEKNHPRLCRPKDRWLLLNKFIGMKERSEVGAKRADAVIPVGLKGREYELWLKTAASFEINAGLPDTLLHGDSHVGQTYITDTGKLGIGDWQATMRGGWAFDYAYTVASALKVEDRRKWDEDLLRFYLDKLHQSGGPQYRFEDAWLLYRQHTLWPYIVWLYTIGYGPLQPKMQPDQVCMDIVERTGHALNDLDGLGSHNV